jgi:hypothetical protein
MRRLEVITLSSPGVVAPSASTICVDTSLSLDTGIASVATRIVARLCPPVASGASALVILTGECDEDASHDLARAVAAAGAAELLAMLGAAREAFPDEEPISDTSFSTLYVTALLIDADSSASSNSSNGENGGETLFDALLPNMRPAPTSCHRGPFSNGGGGRPLTDTSPSSPSISAVNSITLRDDPAAGGVVARGLKVAACFSVGDVASLLVSLSRTTPSGSRTHSLITMSISQNVDAPRLAVLRLAKASGSVRGVPQWVAATARVLASIESRSPHISFAASRVSLIMRDALNGRVESVFVAATPRGPPAVVTASLQFAARIKSAAEILSAGVPPFVVTQSLRGMNNNTIQVDEQEQEQEQVHPHILLPLSPKMDEASSNIDSATQNSDELAASSRALFSSTLSALEHSRSECIALQERVTALAASAAAAAVAVVTNTTTPPLKTDKNSSKHTIPTSVSSRPSLSSSARKNVLTTLPKGSMAITTTSATLVNTLDIGSSSSSISISTASQEIAALQTRVASLTASNRTLASSSRDFSLYREVVEASVARLQSDIVTLAAARDESIASNDEIRATLSKERRALGASRRRVTELEAHVAALEAAAAGKAEATTSVAAMRTALREARAAGAGSEAAATSARDAALTDASNLRQRLRLLESSYDSAQREIITLRTEAASILALTNIANSMSESSTTSLLTPLASTSSTTLSPSVSAESDLAITASRRPPLARPSNISSQKARSVLVSPPSIPLSHKFPPRENDASVMLLDLATTRPPPPPSLVLPSSSSSSSRLSRSHIRVKVPTPKTNIEVEEETSTAALAAALRALQKRDPRLLDLSKALAVDMGAI